MTVISDADNNNNKNMIADVRWANQQKTDIYVSVHCDYSKAPSGVMPLYVSSGGKKLATALNNAVKSGMGMRSRGVIRRTDLWELNGTDMVACILETGAIKADLSTLKKNPDAYGKCIAKGICDYLGIKAAVPAKPKTTAPAAKPSTATTKKAYTGAYPNTNVSTGGSAKIAAKANEYAYAYGTAKSKSKYPSGKPTAAYKKALASLPYSEHKWDAGARSGANCDVFVWTCVRKAGVDNSFPSGLWRQLRYMNAHPDKYVKVKTSSAMPGDIFFYRKNVKGTHGHIGICYSGGMVKEASHLQYYGRTNKALKSRLSKTGKKYVYVFRVKGSGRNYLMKGDQGAEVKKLQAYINWFDPKNKLSVDGDFGPKTDAAVKAMQKALKVDPDGKVGPKTLDAMKKYKK